MLKERLESIKNSMKYYNNNYIVEKLLNLAYDYNLEDYVMNIINRDEIDDLVQIRLNKSGWEGVACMLSKINYVTDEYYLMDRYGNLEGLTKDGLKCIFDDLEYELLNLIEEEEEEEE